MKKVSRRGGFSDRYGIKRENTAIQLNEFDERTRIQLWNMIMCFYQDAYGCGAYYGNSWIQDFFRYILGDVYTEAVDTRKKYDDDVVLEQVKQTILHGDYDEVLTLVEAIVQYWDENGYCLNADVYSGRYKDISFFRLANEVFERECLGYRFIGGKIVPVSDSFEVEAVAEAIENEFLPVREHLSKASGFLADREHPDYENSIKESISAVEALSEIITGTKGKEATLGNMLKKIEEKGIVIHGGLKSAFNSLYGYTSDAKGIRHAGDIGGPASTFAEAKFMLVACSAFVNYLTAIDED